MGKRRGREWPPLFFCLCGRISFGPYWLLPIRSLPSFHSRQPFSSPAGYYLFSLLSTWRREKRNWRNPALARPRPPPSTGREKVISPHPSTSKFPVPRASTLMDGETIAISTFSDCWTEKE